MSVASKNQDDREGARKVIDDMMENTGWTPDTMVIFAGALQYNKYGLLTRFIMKKIAASESLATDTRYDYEYTDWGSVEEFSNTLADNILNRPE